MDNIDSFSGIVKKAYRKAILNAMYNMHTY
jgi:hypothetical protein